MPDDVIINKISSIERCIARAKQEYEKAESFADNYTFQDAAVLNVLRACEQTIDLANYTVRKMSWRVPVSSADSFQVLKENEILNPDLTARLQKMVHFRNMIIHQYEDMNLDLVVGVIESGYKDLEALCRAVYNAL